jgi:hypothetical protein
MKSIISAYEAFSKGIKLEEYDSGELKRAIGHFGKVSY